MFSILSFIITLYLFVFNKLIILTQSCKSETDIKGSALELIGNTPLVALDRLWPGPGRILAKCEFLNPSASIKDRSALYMINKAIENGDLKPNEPVLEVTSGNQGGGVALVGAILGHNVTLVMSAGNSPQRAILMRALGGNVVLAPQVDGQPGSVTLNDSLASKELGRKIVEETGAFFLNQYMNDNNYRAHEETTGQEIWRQTGGRVDGFVCAVGTGGTFMGISRYLKKKNKSIICGVVEPTGAEVLAGKNITKHLHLLQGAGSEKIPNIFKESDLKNIDMTFDVTDEEVINYRKLLGYKEGLYLGYTSGANVAAAVKLLQSGKLAKDAWVVTVLPDSGLKYPN